MKKFNFLLMASLLAIAAGAQQPSFQEMKSSLNSSSIPLVNLTVDISKVNKPDYTPATIEIVDYKKRTNPDSVSVTYNCKVKYRGSSSLRYDKKSFAVKTLNDAGKSLDVNVFGIRADDSWILDAMAVDRLRMRNRVCFDVWNDISATPYSTDYDNRNGTKGVFVEVFINGEYHGLYCMTDKINRKLLGLKKIQEETDGSMTVRGVLYKGDSWASAYDLLSYDEADVDSDTWNAWELQYPDDYPSENTWKPLMDLIDFCSDATSDEDFNANWEKWFYKQNLVDYMVFTLALGIGDNGWKNAFLSTTNVAKSHCYLVTPWDMDMSFGGNWDGTYFEKLYPITRYNKIAPYNRLFGNDIDGFKELVAFSWEDKMWGIFSDWMIAKRLQDYANSFTKSGAWEREYNKWNGNPVELKEVLQDEVDIANEWYLNSWSTLRSQYGKITGINDVNINNGSTDDNRIFSIDGREFNADINNLPAGIYISKGKKIIKK